MGRKGELTDRIIAYLVHHGPADLSLRPMAAAIGTSARLLIFHFGSKEGLLTEVLGTLQGRMRASILRLGSEPVRPGPLLRVVWDWALEEPWFGQLRLLYQLHALAAQAPDTYGAYLQGNALDWMALVQAAQPPDRRDPALVTLIVAVFDGLFLECMSTGDRTRTTAALDRFLALAARKRGEGPVGTQEVNL
jgi:AcrR family transcriptional regulator